MSSQIYSEAKLCEIERAWVDGENRRRDSDIQGLLAQTRVLHARIAALEAVSRKAMPFLRSAHTCGCSILGDYVLASKPGNTCDCGTAARAGEIKDVLWWLGES